MSNGLDNDGALQPETPAEVAPSADPAAPEGGVTAAELEALENVDFLLEEIENKIAPLALA